ncbi:MAG: RCC1 domain-containing protein [Roseiflexaceae bacterium]
MIVLALNVAPSALSVPALSTIARAAHEASGVLSSGSVGAGAYHTCGLRIDGTVSCWGSNSDGQSNAPGGTFTQISAGGFHSCGVKTDGTLACWGYQPLISPPVKLQREGRSWNSGQMISLANPR